MTQEQIAQEALARATQGNALTNLPAIFSGFMEKGIPQHDIEPRINVLTFHAWKAKGRHVLKGQHGVKVLTWISGSKEIEDPDTGEMKEKTWKRPKTAVVFHISQTESN